MPCQVGMLKDGPNLFCTFSGNRKLPLDDSIRQSMQQRSRRASWCDSGLGEHQSNGGDTPVLAL